MSSDLIPLPERGADFIAIIKYRTTEEGGRQTPALSGYRPQIKFSFSEMQTSEQQTFLDKEIVYPGDTVKAEVKIVSVDFFVNCLEEGMNFEMREGPKIVATGTVIEIINQHLRK